MTKTLSDKIFIYKNRDGKLHSVMKTKDVKEFVAERIQESTKLLSLFNQGKLTSVDLREHRQKIKDDAGDL